MLHAHRSPETQEVLAAWQPYIHAIEDWQELVKGTEPKSTSCGPVYELSGLPGRPNESFAIADMRGVEYAQPHYHQNETELYVVLQGLGQVVVGNEALRVEAEDTIVTPAGTTHYVIPDKASGLVLAVVNTPPFSPENVIEVMATDLSVGYDHEQFMQLIHAQD